MARDSLYIGVDPGKSGAIAFICGDEVWAVKNDATPHDLSGALLDAVNMMNRTFAIVERVSSGVFGAGRTQGVKSAFTFGESFGLLQGLLVAHTIPFDFVAPATWQTAMKCRTKGDKNVSKAAAQRLFPDMKVTHAIADALLLAEYCKREKQ